MRFERIAVAGGGAWGTALANAAALAGRKVVWWMRDPEAAERVAAARENARYLPGVRLHDRVTPTADLALLAEADAALLVVPAQTVRTVAQGRKYVTPEIAQMLVESLTSPNSENAHDRLSDREMQTLEMIASGKRLSDIAEELMLSPKTVSVYRARVLEKLGLTNNSEMTVYAIRSGLVGN